jgi:hypothetical protein
MKFSIYFVTVLGVVLLVSHARALSQENKDMMKKMAEECRKKEGASEDEVELMTKQEYPKTKEG